MTRFHAKTKYGHYFSQRGFTLIELVVAAGVFASTVAIASGFFITILRIQRNAEQNQNVADNARSALEIMTRVLRVGTLCPQPINCTATAIEARSPTKTAGSCLTPPCTIRYEWSPPSSICGAAGRACITERNAADPPSSALPITSQQLNINRLDFVVSGLGIPPADTNQPRVTIILEAEGMSTRPGERAKLNLQTTVTQRELDF